MDRKQFIRKYGIRGHSTTFIVMVYTVVAFLLLNNSADVPDEWWQSIEVAYQHAYLNGGGGAKERQNISETISANGQRDHREFPDGPLFINSVEVPRTERKLFQPSVLTFPSPQPTPPITPELAYGVRPWEWQQPSKLRSFTYPMVFYGIFSGLRAVDECVLEKERRQISSSPADEEASLGTKNDDRSHNVKDNASSAAGNAASVFTTPRPDNCDGSTAFTNFVVDLFVPSVFSHADAVEWIQTLFYILPRVVAIIIAVLLHKACCSFGASVFEEILLMLPTFSSSPARQNNKKPSSPAKTVNATTAARPKANRPSDYLWDEDVTSLRNAIAPTTADKFNKRVSIFVLTNFMFLYMSSRSLSNMPEALVFMWCLAIYGRFRVNKLSSEGAKRKQLASLIGDKFELSSAFADASEAVAGSDTNQDRAARGNQDSEIRSPSAFVAALKLLFVGGFGCVLRTTMAVPFAFVYLAFLLDVLGVTSLALPKTIKKRPSASTTAEKCRNNSGPVTKGKESLQRFLRTVRSLQLIGLASLAFVVFWLAIVLVIDSWYYCGTSPVITVHSLFTNPTSVRQSFYLFDTEKSGAGAGGELSGARSKINTALSSSLGNSESYTNIQRQCTYAFSLLNFYKFNFQKGHSSFFGSHPWWWYFALGAPACVGANIVFFILWAILKVSGAMRRVEQQLTNTFDDQKASKESASEAQSKVAAAAQSALGGTLGMRFVSHSPLLKRLVFIVFASTGVYSLLEHKEMRFVFPFVTGPLMVACAVFYEELNNWASAKVALTAAGTGKDGATSPTADSEAKRTESKYQVPFPRTNGAPTSPHHHEGLVGNNNKGAVGRKTFVQRLALLCLIANIAGLIFIGKAFKVGPPAAAHYFRSAAFGRELEDLKRISEGKGFDKKTQNSVSTPGVLKSSDGGSHHPSLHIWAGCYSMPGPSFYHHVFRSIRSVSCNTMAVVDGREDEQKKMSKSSSSKGSKRYPTEHELFLQYPEMFIAHVYGDRIAKANATGQLMKPETEANEKQPKTKQVPEETDKKKKAEGGDSASPPRSSSSSLSFLSSMLKKLQSKAAQDEVPHVPTPSSKGKQQTATAAEEQEKGAFEKKLSEAIEGITVAGQRLFTDHNRKGAAAKLSVSAKDEILEETGIAVDVGLGEGNDRKGDLLLHASLYGGLLGFSANVDEPLPDVVVTFSSLPESIERTILLPLGYTKRKQFYHTFAVVDEGSGHNVEIWMRNV